MTRYRKEELKKEGEARPVPPRPLRLGFLFALLLCGVLLGFAGVLLVAGCVLASGCVLALALGVLTFA